MLFNKGINSAYLQELPNILAFGDTPQLAVEELKTAWELVKEDYQHKGKTVPTPPNKQTISTN